MSRRSTRLSHSLSGFIIINKHEGTTYRCKTEVPEPADHPQYHEDQDQQHLYTGGDKSDTLNELCQQYLNDGPDPTNIHPEQSRYEPKTRHQAEQTGVHDQHRDYNMTEYADLNDVHCNQNQALFDKQDCPTYQNGHQIATDKTCVTGYPNESNAQSDPHDQQRKCNDINPSESSDLRQGQRIQSLYNKKQNGSETKSLTDEETAHDKTGHSTESNALNNRHGYSTESNASNDRRGLILKKGRILSPANSDTDDDEKSPSVSPALDPMETTQTDGNSTSISEMWGSKQVDLSHKVKQESADEAHTTISTPKALKVKLYKLRDERGIFKSAKKQDRSKEKRMKLHKLVSKITDQRSINVGQSSDDIKTDQQSKQITDHNSKNNYKGKAWLHNKRQREKSASNCLQKEHELDSTAKLDTRSKFNSKAKGVLNHFYEHTPYPSREKIVSFSRRFRVKESVVKNWFNDRRKRDKSDDGPRARANNITPALTRKLMAFYNKNGYPSKQEMVKIARLNSLSVTCVNKWFSKVRKDENRSSVAKYLHKEKKPKSQSIKITQTAGTLVGYEMKEVTQTATRCRNSPVANQSITTSAITAIHQRDKDETSPVINQSANKTYPSQSDFEPDDTMYDTMDDTTFNECRDVSLGIIGVLEEVNHNPPVAYEQTNTTPRLHENAILKSILSEECGFKHLHKPNKSLSQPQEHSLKSVDKSMDKVVGGENDVNSVHKPTNSLPNNPASGFDSRPTSIYKPPQSLLAKPTPSSLAEPSQSSLAEHGQELQSQKLAPAPVNEMNINTSTVMNNINNPPCSIVIEPQLTETVQGTVQDDVDIAPVSQHKLEKYFSKRTNPTESEVELLSDHLDIPLEKIQKWFVKMRAKKQEGSLQKSSDSGASVMDCDDRDDDCCLILGMEKKNRTVKNVMKKEPVFSHTVLPQQSTSGVPVLELGSPEITSSRPAIAPSLPAYQEPFSDSLLSPPRSKSGFNSRNPCDMTSVKKVPRKRASVAKQLAVDVGVFCVQDQLDQTLKTEPRRNDPPNYDHRIEIQRDHRKADQRFDIQGKYPEWTSSRREPNFSNVKEEILLVHDESKKGSNLTEHQICKLKAMKEMNSNPTLNDLYVISTLLDVSIDDIAKWYKDNKHVIQPSVNSFQQPPQDMYTCGSTMPRRSRYQDPVAATNYRSSVQSGNQKGNLCPDQHNVPVCSRRSSVSRFVPSYNNDIKSGVTKVEIDSDDDVIMVDDVSL